MAEKDPDTFAKYAEAESQAEEACRTSEELRESGEDLLRKIRRPRTAATHDPPYEPDDPVK